MNNNYLKLESFFSNMWYYEEFWTAKKWVTQVFHYEYFKMTLVFLKVILVMASQTYKIVNIVSRASSVQEDININWCKSLKIPKLDK